MNEIRGETLKLFRRGLLDILNIGKSDLKGCGRYSNYERCDENWLWKGLG